MGGMFGGMGDEVTASAGSEESPQQARAPVRKGVGDNKTDANGAEQDARGRFTANGKSYDLQERKNNGTISSKETTAPEWFVEQNRTLLMNAEIK